jgi:hypothetical protein
LRLGNYNRAEVKGLAMPPSSRLAPFTAVVFSPRVAAVTALATVLIVLGCMCLNFTCETNADGTVTQENHIDVPPNMEIEVFYAVPYASPPNLSIDEVHGDCTVTEQKENHFRVRNRNVATARTVNWTARGMPAAATQIIRPAPPAVGGPPPNPQPPPRPQMEAPTNQTEPVEPPPQPRPSGGAQLGQPK